MKKSELKQMIRESYREVLEEAIPNVTIPSAIKARLMKAKNQIQKANLSYNQKLNLIFYFISNLGIDSKQLVKMSAKIKGQL